MVANVRVLVKEELNKINNVANIKTTNNKQRKIVVLNVIIVNLDILMAIIMVAI